MHSHPIILSFELCLLNHADIVFVFYGTARYTMTVYQYRYPVVKDYAFITCTRNLFFS